MVVTGKKLIKERFKNVEKFECPAIKSLSKLSWRDCKRGRKGIHVTKNGSNKRHVISMGVNARAHYQMPV